MSPRDRSVSARSLASLILLPDGFAVTDYECDTSLSPITTHSPLLGIGRGLDRFGLAQFYDDLAQMLRQLLPRDRVKWRACMFGQEPNGVRFVVAHPYLPDR